MKTSQIVGAIVALVCLGGLGMATASGTSPTLAQQGDEDLPDSENSADRDDGGRRHDDVHEFLQVVMHEIRIAEFHAASYRGRTARLATVMGRYRRDIEEQRRRAAADPPLPPRPPLDWTRLEEAEKDQAEAYAELQEKLANATDSMGRIVAAIDAVEARLESDPDNERDKKLLEVLTDARERLRTLMVMVGSNDDEGNGSPGADTDSATTQQFDPADFPRDSEQALTRHATDILRWVIPSRNTINVHGHSRPLRYRAARAEIASALPEDHEARAAMLAILERRENHAWQSLIMAYSRIEEATAALQQMADYADEQGWTGVAFHLRSNHYENGPTLHDDLRGRDWR